MIPAAWPTVLLALAAYRSWRLLAEDDILNDPRDRLLARWPQLDEFIACPWCLGFWIGGAWWAAWWWWPDTTLAIAALPAISVAVGAAAMLLKP